MAVPVTGGQGLTGVDFVLSAEGVPGANQITVQANLRHGISPLDARYVVGYYLSSDAAGATMATDPGTTAMGTDGVILVEWTDDLLGYVLSAANGDLDFVITHAGTSGFYLNIVLPSGRLVTSPIIQFA